MRERNAIARDARRRYLSRERERARWADASTSYGAPPPLPPMIRLPSQPEHIPPATQEHCLAELWDSAVFWREILDVATAAFFQGFDDCKARLLRIIPYLELHGMQTDGTDKEVETSIDED